MLPHKPELRTPTDLLGMINVSGIMDGARIDGRKAFDSLAAQEIPGLTNIKMENRVNMARNQLPRIISEAKTIDIIDQHRGEDGSKLFITIHCQVDGHDARLIIPASNINKYQMDRILEANKDKFARTTQARSWNDQSREALGIELTDGIDIDQNLLEKNFRMVIDHDASHTEEIYATNFNSLDGNGMVGWKGTVKRGPNLTESVDISSRIKTDIYPDSEGGTEKFTRNYTSIRLSRNTSTLSSTQDPHPGQKRDEEEVLEIDINPTHIRPTESSAIHWGKRISTTNSERGYYEASRYEGLMNTINLNASYISTEGWHIYGGPPAPTMGAEAFNTEFPKAQIKEGSHDIPDIARAISNAASIIPEEQKFTDEGHQLFDTEASVKDARAKRINEAARKIENRPVNGQSRDIAEHFGVQPEAVQQFQNLIQSLGLRFAADYQLVPTVFSEMTRQVDGTNRLLAHIPQLTALFIEIPNVREAVAHTKISPLISGRVDEAIQLLEKQLFKDALESIPTWSYYKAVSPDQLKLLANAVQAKDFRAYVENVLLLYQGSLETAGLSAPQNLETFLKLRNETGLNAWYQQQFGEDITVMNTRYTRDHQGMYEPPTFTRAPQAVS